jgi:hypothetical protein
MTERSSGYSGGFFFSSNQLILTILQETDAPASPILWIQYHAKRLFYIAILKK